MSDTPFTVLILEQLYHLCLCPVFPDQLSVHSLIQEGASVLIVIIDGLSWQWKDYLINSFKTNGFYLEREPEIKFSLIPSVSEISKPAIISGLNLSDNIE